MQDDNTKKTTENDFPERVEAAIDRMGAAPGVSSPGAPHGSPVARSAHDSAVKSIANVMREGIKPERFKQAGDQDKGDSGPSR